MSAGTTPARSRAAPDAGQLRMLDELEAVVRPRQVQRSSAPPGWLIALLAGGVAVAVAAGLWWGKHRSEPAAQQVAQAVASAPAKPAATPALPEPPVAASAAPAVIETVAAALAAAEPEASASSAASSAAAAAAVAPRPAPRPAPVAVAPKPSQGKVTTVVTSSGGKWTTTVADASATDAAATAAKPKAAADKPLSSPAAAVTRAPKADDADVKLLSALLAHVSRSGPATPLADDDQVTLAQVVKRCDARPAAEVRECRRRICEGYWGKAEACPALAPVPAKKG